MKKIFNLLLKIFISLFIVIFLISAGIYIKYRMELPNINQLVEDYSPSLPTIIYDRNGEVVDTLFEETRNLVKIDEVPQVLKDAFISIEDKNFYKHHGVNPKRILGALITNVKNKRASQGASTISQQLAKNAFLTQEKKLSRKIKELIITLEIERKYTKNEIFERYLNEIYYGSGYYGVKTATKFFLKKDIKDLNLAEAALMAGIPNRPSKYDPIKHLDTALERQRLVLNEMLNDKKISKEEYENALKHKFVVESEKLSEKVKNDKNTTIIYNKPAKLSYTNPEFTSLVEDFLQTILPENKIYSGGLKVYTTLDLNFQKIAKNVFDSYPFLQKKDLNGAMVTINQIGGIVSIVGGKDFKAKNFDRAMMARRQVGSAIKPFVYLASLQQGYSPYNVIEDKFISYGKWKPKNYGAKYSGNNTLSTALNKSINTIAIKLLEGTGIENFSKLTKELSFYGNVNDLTAALGTVEATPIRLALNYAIFINGGYKIDYFVVNKVDDQHSNTLYEKEDEKEKILESADVSTITAMLKNVVARGSGSQARVFNKNGTMIEQGGKTGTTNENRTVWFAGITPDYVTVAYIGRDDNKPIYGKVTGGTSVAPLWRNYYQELINKDIYKPKKFSYLENSLEVGELVNQSIDLLTGLTSSNGSELVIRRGYIQVENLEKYKNGLASIFNIDINEKSFENSEDIFYEEDFKNNIDKLIENNKIDTSSEKIVDSGEKEDTTIKDDLFERLLGE